MGHGGHDSVVPPLVGMAHVVVIGDHRLRLSFEDSTVGHVAFDEREWRGVFEPLANPDVFSQVRIEMGTIAYGPAHLRQASARQRLLEWPDAKSMIRSAP